MAETSAESIVSLLDAQDPELRWAAAKVLGALRPHGDDVVPALARLLAAEDMRVRAAALEAIAAIGPGPALKEVLALLEEPGAVGRRAVDVLAGLGPTVLGPLHDRLAGASETGRRRILTLAARVRGAAGMDLIADALEAGHGEAVPALGARLAGELAQASPREREAIRRRLESFLDSPGAKDHPQSVAAALDMLVSVSGADAQRRLVAFAGPEHTAEVRRRALDALKRIAAESRLDDEVVGALFGCLGDPDFGNVVAPAMAVLESAKLSAAHAPGLLALLRGQDPALRRFAVTALGQVDTPTSAAALLDVLRGENPELQKRAALALSKQRSALAPVAEALVEAADAPTAWVLARILNPHADRLKPEQVAALASACASWLETGDPRAEAILNVLRDGHSEALAEANLKRVKRIRKDRKGSEIVNLIRPLLRDGAPVPVSLRYELALAEVIRGRKDVARESRLEHPGLLLIEELFRDPEFGLAQRLKRDRGLLTPEEYFLIGCHFAERTYAERAFGGEMLEWVASTFPEDNVARAAEQKLQMEGFPPPPPRVAAKPAAPAARPPRKAANCRKGSRKASRRPRH